MSRWYHVLYSREISNVDVTETTEYMRLYEDMIYLRRGWKKTYINVFDYFKYFLFWENETYKNSISVNVSF